MRTAQQAASTSVPAGEYPTRGCMRPVRVPEECPQQMADLCSQCMSENPSDRPTAGELVERLTELGKLAKSPQ